MDQKNLEAVMGLIMYSGNAKSDAMEAIQASKRVQFRGSRAEDERRRKIAGRSSSCSNRDITQEAQGENVEINI